MSFYDQQMLDHINPRMREFIARQEMVFVATADAHGECDCSFRAGLPGFVFILDDKTLTYPEFRGNGVMASIGNLFENPHIGLVFMDFFQSTVGLHVNGKAHVLTNQEIQLRPDLPAEIVRAIQTKARRRPERWILVEVSEAYIHCSKHVPLLQKADKTIHWGTDNANHKGGDYFRASAYSRREALGEDGGDGAAVVILGHGGGEVGGGVIRAGAPVEEQAVGPAIEHAVDANRFAPA